MPLHAANAVPELRQRIAGKGIIEYSQCPTSHTVALVDGVHLSRFYQCLDGELKRFAGER